MIRLAVPDDVPALVQIEELLFPDNCLGEVLFRGELLAGRGFVAGDFHGYALIREDGPLIDLTRLGVLPAWQHQGIGSLLLEEILALGRETMLTVKKDNVLALRLYTRRGFRIVAVAALEAAWVMRRPARGRATCTQPRTPRTEEPRSRRAV